MSSAADAQRYSSSVRLPSHVDPPFKARTWSNFSPLRLVAGTAPPGINVAFTLFGGSATGIALGPAQSVPPGMRAEITWINVSALDLGGVVSAAPEVITATIRKNGPTIIGNTGGQVVPGWDGFGLHFSTTIGAFELIGESVPVLAPIHLEEGETAVLSVAMFAAGLATSWAVQARWAGWVYPIEIEGEAGTIRATAQDPGVREPLSDRFRPRR